MLALRARSLLNGRREEEGKELMVAIGRGRKKTYRLEVRYYPAEGELKVV